MVSLSVPVKRGSFHKTAMRDLQIDHHKPWQDIHWKTIQAAYSASPFYEYYIDDLAPFFSDRSKFLWDHNLKIMDAVLEQLRISKNYRVSTGYIAEIHSKTDLDYRESIHPKCQVPDAWFQSLPYHQVFEDRSGFIPDLSILDLIFNTGPDATEILRKTLTPPGTSAEPDNTEDS